MLSHQNINVVTTGSTFEGSCMACDDPGLGGTITILEVGRNPFKIRLCPLHTNLLIEKLQKAGARRDI